MPATSAGMTAVSVAPQKQNTGEMFSPVSNCFAVAGLVVVNPRKSERTQQNGADKHEHGAHRQHIELQGMVHVCLPV